MASDRWTRKNLQLLRATQPSQKRKGAKKTKKKKKFKAKWSLPPGHNANG